MREYRGTLTSSTADDFTIETENGSRTISKSAVAYVKADDDNDF
jgi:hypothetical protein